MALYSKNTLSPTWHKWTVSIRALLFRPLSRTQTVDNGMPCDRILMCAIFSRNWILNSAVATDSALYLARTNGRDYWPGSRLMSPSGHQYIMCSGAQHGAHNQAFYFRAEFPRPEWVMGEDSLLDGLVNSVDWQLTFKHLLGSCRIPKWKQWDILTLWT